MNALCASTSIYQIQHPKKEKVNFAKAKFVVFNVVVVVVAARCCNSNHCFERVKKHNRETAGIFPKEKGERKKIHHSLERNQDFL